jgi:uncharacterized membrane protein YfcA
MILEVLAGSPAFIIVAGGFGVGFLVGVTGVGAGSLMTPFLISSIGIAPVIAVGTDLLFAAITKASGAWRHHVLGNVDWRIVRRLVMGSLPGAAMTLGWLYLFKPETEYLASLIRHVLAMALIFSSAAIIVYPLLIARPRPDAATSNDAPVRPLATTLLGFVLGALVALTSVGAGAIGVVVLTALYPLIFSRRIIGTDIVHAIPLTLVTGISHLGMGHVDLKLLGLLLLGSVPGIALGSRVTQLLPDWLLRVLLAVVLCYAAWQLTAKG